MVTFAEIVALGLLVYAVGWMLDIRRNRRERGER
jgi:hypothetical protein